MNIKIKVTQDGGGAMNYRFGALVASIILLAISVFVMGTMIKTSIKKHASQQNTPVEESNYWQDPLLQKRIIVFTDTITRHSSKLLISKLIWLESEKPATAINIILKTKGGKRSDWIAVVNTMQLLSSPVNVISIGTTVSAGAYILAAATGDRIMLDQTLIGIHMVFREYDTSSVESKFSDEQKYDHYLRKFWSAHAQLPADFLPKHGKDYNETFYLNADEALRYKVIDRIVKRDELSEFGSAFIAGQ